MNDFLKRFGQWGMVAGAAEGIGAAYCVELAKRGMNVIMVDVKEPEMASLAKKLEISYKVHIQTVGMDLAQKDAPEKCMAAMVGLDCRLLVYNAAYSRVKPFIASSREELDLYINVNTRTPEHLVYLFANRLKNGHQSGGVLLMASLAGIWGSKFVAAYSATKAFNMRLAEALSFEFRPYHIDICAVCAGATATPGYLGTNPAGGFPGPNVMQPGRVASIAMKKMGKKTIIIPGTGNRFNYFLLTRILPRSLSVRMVNFVMGRTYRQVK